MNRWAWDRAVTSSFVRAGCELGTHYGELGTHYGRRVSAGLNGRWHSSAATRRRNVWNLRPLGSCVEVLALAVVPLTPLMLGGIMIGMSWLEERLVLPPPSVQPTVRRSNADQAESFAAREADRPLRPVAA